MAPKYLLKQEYFFYDNKWTEAADKLFIEVLLDQQSIDNFHLLRENKIALLIAMDVVNKQFNQAFDLTFCIARLAMLEKRYRIFRWLKRKHGVTWDSESNIITARDEVWTEILKRDPFALAYQEFGEPRWNELYVLFDGLFSYDPNDHPKVIELSSDSEANDIRNMEGLPTPPPKSNIVNISESESSGARSFWKYLQNFGGGYEFVPENSVNQPAPRSDQPSGSRPPVHQSPFRYPRNHRRPNHSSPSKSTKSLDTSGSSSRPP